MEWLWWFILHLWWCYIDKYLWFLYMRRRSRTVWAAALSSFLFGHRFPLGVTYGNCGTVPGFQYLGSVVHDDKSHKSPLRILWGYSIWNDLGIRFFVLCFVVAILWVSCVFIWSITYSPVCFAGTSAVCQVPQCQWSYPEGCGEIDWCERKPKHNNKRIICIFVWTFCMGTVECNLLVVARFEWNLDK